jgi:hypothetical protein
VQRWFSLFALGLGAATLACSPPQRTTPPPPVVAGGEPSARVVDFKTGWSEVVWQHVQAAAADGRMVSRREFQWTDEERAELEPLREDARGVVERASEKDRPWLLAAYVQSFASYGIGARWADALVEIPPAHPVWSIWALALFVAMAETSDPDRLRSYVDAVASVQDAPMVQAVATRLRLEQADRAGDWERARALYATLEAIRVPTESGTAMVPVLDALDARMLDPHRPLRAGVTVPHYCAPAIQGPEAGRRVCLDEQFPHGQITLVVGSAAWCGSCVEHFPRLIESLAGQDLRVIAVSQDHDAQSAREYLAQYPTEAWTVLLAERSAATSRRSLAGQPIPFLALVDRDGTVLRGRPRFDVDDLAAQRQSK